MTNHFTSKVCLPFLSFLLTALSFLSASAQSDQIVRGKVVSENNEPLPGVNVIVKGTSNGTSTDANGAYSLPVKDINSTLIFSFIGYLNQEISLNGKIALDITLATDVKALSEVVVVGYGTQRKSDVTSSISKVDVGKIQNLPVSGVEQALQGRVAGVQVTSASGLPGSPIMVRIRGLGTINNNDPLYIVDGVLVSNINYLNPSDVESMEILKDASAAAIYGSRAANGVVLITTKQGKAGKTLVAVDGYIGVSNPWKAYKPAGADEYLYMAKTVYGEGTTDYDKTKTAFDKGHNTNWWKETIKEAVVQNYNVSISGGTEKAHYAMSAAYFNQKGNVKPSGYQRLSFRVNSDYQVRDWLKIGESVSISNEITQRTTTDILQRIQQYDPLVPVLDPAKDQSDPYSKFSSSTITFGSNPRALLARQIGQNTALRMVGNAFVNMKLLKNLAFNSSLGLELTRGESSSFSPKYFLNASDRNDTRSASAGSNSDNHWILTNTLNYNQGFGLHNFGVLAGISAEKFNGRGISGTRFGQTSNDPLYQYIDAGSASGNDQVYGGGGQSTLASYFGRINYSYSGKYLLQASFRRDGTSNFADGTRWGNFPSVSAGWVISNENFWNALDLNWFNSLKLRGGWGQLGNQNVPSAGAYSTFIAGGNRRYVFSGPTGDIIMQGAGLDNLGNSELHWETSEQSNVGLELGLFNNALTATAEYYNRNTKDMIIAYPIAGTFGVGSPVVNAGSTRNRGIELTVNYDGKIGKLGYSIGGNVSHYKNQVTSLGEGEPYVEEIPLSRVTGHSRTAVGRPIGEFYGWKTDGIFQSQQEIDGYASEGKKIQPNARPGDMRFVDINGDGVIDDKDKTAIGSPHPKLLYGGNLTLNYKNFDLTLFLQGSVGNKTLNINKYIIEQPLGFDNIKEGAAYATWTPENQSNTHPAMSRNDPNNNYRTSDWYVENGSYMRVKNVQIGYNLPAKILGRINMSQVRIYIASQNLFTFTKYSGLDPEVGAYSLSGDRNKMSRLTGVDYFTFPQARTFQLGASVKF